MNGASEKCIKKRILHRNNLLKEFCTEDPSERWSV